MTDKIAVILRVLRGGSWYDLDHICLCKTAHKAVMDGRRNHIGFRLVREKLQPQTKKRENK